MYKFVPETDKEMMKAALNKAKFFVRHGIRKNSDEFMVFLGNDNEFLVCTKTGKCLRRISDEAV